MERRLETIANNVANMDTVGYRAEGVSFETEVAKAGDNRIAYVSSGSSFISRQTGASIKTGNPLDLAIQGSGWFAINTADGTAYTRDGRMRLSETGALETLNGDAVLDAGGAPILLSPSAGAPVISGDGMIAQDGKQVGAIGLFAIDDDAKLRRAENSGVVPDKPATPILDFTQERRRSGVRRRRQRQSDPGDDQTDRGDAGLRRRHPASDANRIVAARGDQDARLFQLGVIVQPKLTLGFGA